MRIGIVYGSTTGNTEEVAEGIAEKLRAFGEVRVHNVERIDLGEMGDCDALILGTSTWGAGEIQDGWVGKDRLDGLDLRGKKTAVFGCGDQEGFGSTFVDGMGVLARNAEKAGATLIGAWPTEGYSFVSSAAVRGGEFVGLALDNDNQPNLTQARIARWAEQLREELGT